MLFFLTHFESFKNVILKTPRKINRITFQTPVVKQNIQINNRFATRYSSQILDSHKTVVVLCPVRAPVTRCAGKGGEIVQNYRNFVLKVDLDLQIQEREKSKIAA